MIFPTDEDQLKERVRYLIDQCLSTREQRARIYEWREKLYLFGTAGFEQSKYNRLESHLDLVTSFLYAPDHAFFHISSDTDDDRTMTMATTLQDDFNDDFQTCGISDAIMESIVWSLVYDTMIPKQGWNRDRGQWFIKLIPPHNFGVYQEAEADLDSQQCFCHADFLDYQTAAGKLILSGMKDLIPRMEVTNTASLSPFPEMLQRMIISGTGGGSLAGNIFGQVNPDYTPAATYQPKSDVPLVRFDELWAWDDTYQDYRVFHMLEPDLLIGDSRLTMSAYQSATRNVTWLFDKIKELGKEPSQCNPFFPGEHPFSKIQPYGKYNYFWGKAHIDSLIPLQEWMLERLDQIADVLERQADPARVGSGFLGLSEEKMAAFGGAGTYLFDQLPQAKVEELKPDMPPDMFAEFDKITGMMLEASGLTEVMAGRSEQGVRSRQHASELKKTGSGRIKKAALNIESPIVKIGDVGLKLKQAHDDKKLHTPKGDDGKSQSFHASEVTSVRMRVDGHSHSPLFGDESRELAMMLRKFGAIDNEDLIRGTNPPARDTLIHNLRKRQRRQEQMQAKLAAQGIMPGQQGGGRSHHGGKKS